MKNILLATDFSQNAHMAAIHAAALARHTGARLIIFHALDPVPLREDQAAVNYPESEEEVQEKLDALAAELYSLFGISITRLLKPGVVGDEILTLAEKTGADLLLLGLKGAGMLKDGLTGSVAANLLTKSSIPLICIPADSMESLADELQVILRERRAQCNSKGLELLSQITQQFNNGKPVTD